jgi:tripartite-type tricarboxylate transporter receptor subunit TctC
MTRSRATLRSLLGVAFLAQAATTGTHAQEFPSRQIKIIVPTAAGGGFDITARVLADRLASLLGQGVVVENRTGAGTLVGTEAAAKAAPDGYTLLMGAFSNFGLNSGLYAKLPYDPIKDFKPISIVVAFPFVLVARNDLPHRTLKDIVAAARASPGTISYASGGRATGQHVAMAAVEQLNKVSFIHVPYRGAQPAYQDMIGSRIDLMFDNVSTALPQIAGKNVRAVAISAPQRMTQLPDVPTIEQAGGGKLEFESWFGLFAPGATPAAVIDKLSRETAKIVALPDVADRFARTGGRMMGLSGKEAEAMVRSEVERWARVVKEAGITLQ